MFGPDAPPAAAPSQASLVAVREQLSVLVAGLEPSAVPLDEVDALVEVAAQVERLASAAKVLLAGRAAEVPRLGTVDRDGAGFLARVTGSSLGQARTAIETAERLASMPELAAAVRAGQLNEARAAVVADAAAVAPQAERRLVRLARRESMKHLREQARTIKAEADQRTAEQKADEVRRTRRGSSWTTPEGAGEMGLVGPPEAIAEIEAAVTAHRDALFRAGAHQDGATYANLTFDAFLAMARASVRGGDAQKPIAKKVLVRVDRDALLRREVVDGEVCDLPGYGPIPVSIAEDLMRDQTWHAIFTAGIAVAAVTHGQRSANSAQRTALDWSEPLCCVEGCPRPGRFEIDHIDDWARTHQTRHGGLQRLCKYHHDLKTRYGYRYEEQPDGRKRTVTPAEQRLRGPPDERSGRASARRAPAGSGPPPTAPEPAPPPSSVPPARQPAWA